jgi:hypothetical protein
MVVDALLELEWALDGMRNAESVNGVAYSSKEAMRGNRVPVWYGCTIHRMLLDSERLSCVLLVRGAAVSCRSLHICRLTMLKLRPSGQLPTAYFLMFPINHVYAHNSAFLSRNRVCMRSITTMTLSKRR